MHYFLWLIKSPIGSHLDCISWNSHTFLLADNVTTAYILASKYIFYVLTAKLIFVCTICYRSSVSNLPMAQWVYL